MNTTIDSAVFFEVYKNLPTRTDQKILRAKIKADCKLKNATLYQWLQRGYIPDEKALQIIMRILKENNYI